MFWAPLAALSVTAPLRIIDHYTPGIGKHSDAVPRPQDDAYESATIFVTLVVLVAASTALLWAATATGGPGLLVGLLLVSTGVCFWFMALSDYRATPRSTIAAVKLLLRGYDAPSISPGSSRQSGRGATPRHPLRTTESPATAPGRSGDRRATRGA